MKGFRARFRGVVWGGFPVENEGKREGGGEGGRWGGLAKELATRTRLSKSFSPKKVTWVVHKQWAGFSRFGGEPSSQD